MENWNQKRRGIRGFSLAEMLLALGLLSVGLLALIGVLTGGLHLMSKSEEITSATQVARSVIERIKDMEPAAVPENGTFGGSNLANSSGFPPAPFPTTQSNGRTYDLTVTTTRVGPHTVSLEVTVTWEDGGKLTCETYLTK